MPQITITYPAGTGLRFAAALGKAWNLTDAQGEKARGPFVAPDAEMT